MRKPTGMAAALFFLMGATPPAAAELPIAEPTEVGLSQERLDRITAVLEGDVSRKALPGDVLLIARHGKVAYLKALGARDPQANVAMSEDAIFRIYSMSKVITVAAALTLVEDGLVSLDDPIAKYMPQFAHMNVGVAAANPAGGDSNVMQLVPARRPITVQDLMRHSSGITYGFFGDTLVKKAYQGVDLGAASSPTPTSSTASPSCRSPISPARPGTTATRSTCSAASSRSFPANRSTSSRRSAFSIRWK